MKKRLLKATVISTALIIAGCAYTVFYKKFGIGLVCPLNFITGYQCPGCGITRMCLSLMRLDFKAAWSYNPVIMCMLPIGAVLSFNGVKRYIVTGKNDTPKWENSILIVMILILFIYGIVRNII